MKPGKFSGGMGGGMNMNNLMKQAQKMQQDMARVQEELAEREYTGTAGGGAVKVTLKGTSEVIGLEISPEVVDPDDTEMLADLIIAAVNLALKTATDNSEEEMQKITGSKGAPGLF